MNSKTQLMTKTFGVNVKWMRQARNISQEVLAQQSGIYRTYLSRIESGLANPSLLVIAALASALDIDPSKLLLANAAEDAALATSKEGH
jgi:transcriptional regulator with XRE-family HTH domain